MGSGSRSPNNVKGRSLGRDDDLRRCSVGLRSLVRDNRRVAYSSFPSSYSSFPSKGWRPSRASISTTQASGRSEEHTSELQSLMRISYAVFCLKKKKKHI